MKYEIFKYKGFNNVKFGTTRAELHGLFGEPLDSFRKTPFEVFDTDNYNNFFVYYREPDVVEAFEFFGEIDLLYQGYSLLKTSIFELFEVFKKSDDNLEIDETGFVSYENGVSVYLPGWEENGEMVPESILIFEKGYYD